MFESWLDFAHRRLFERKVLEHLEAKRSRQILGKNLAQWTILTRQQTELLPAADRVRALNLQRKTFSLLKSVTSYSRQSKLMKQSVETYYRNVSLERAFGLMRLGV